MKQTIGVLELSRLTGDNRKWVSRNAKNIPSVFWQEKATRGNGCGFRFKTGPVLDSWIKSRREQRDAASAALDCATKAERDAAQARTVAQVIAALGHIVDVTNGNKFLAMAKRIKNPKAKQNLVDEFKGLSRSLAQIILEIEGAKKPGRIDRVSNTIQ